jgi:dipeptidase E
MDKQIICFGGGGFTVEQNPVLDLYVLSASSAEKPVVCFLPTASGDNESYKNYFHHTFSKYNCEPIVADVLSPDANLSDTILESDIIYVGGGNTKSLLALWREWEVDKLLRQAYDKGTILAGVSAGFACWFQEFITDSVPNRLTKLEGLGFITGSCCPHYNSQAGRKKVYFDIINNDKMIGGYAVDDGVGLHFINGKLKNTISSRKKANAYHLNKKSNKLQVEIIEPNYLTHKTMAITSPSPAQGTTV